jgi:GxxExxY protein
MNNKEVKIIDKILYKQESYKIQGAVFEVYENMGCGFLESVYQECLEYEFQEKNIPNIPHKELKIYYKDHLLKQKYIPDFICFEKIILEIKAVKEINNEHRAQILNYLKATGMELGLLINFGHFPKVDILRIASSKK